MEKHEALGSAVAQIERQFGKGSIMRMGDTPMVEMSVDPDGIAGARHRARHRGHPTGQDRGDLRPGELR